MTLHLTVDRATAVAVTAHAENTADARLLLEALGLIEPVRAVRQRDVPPHARCSRSNYVPGCPGCAARNRAYVAAWRLRGKGRRSDAGRRKAALLVLSERAGRGRAAAYPGQLMLEIGA